MACTTATAWRRRVLLCVLSLALPALTRAQHSLQPLDLIEQGMQLYRTWEDAYGLQDDSIFPPPNISLPSHLPHPPHLEDCAARTEFRLATEKRGPNGEPPSWAVPLERCAGVPQPPWVRGPDAANLALTRVVQRDLWEHQFPASCADRRMLLIQWPPPPHGLGAQIHVASTYLSWAVHFNRTLVMLHGSFLNSQNDDCVALRANGSFDCYFFPLVSKDCEQEAMRAFAAGELKPYLTLENHNQELASDRRIVYFDITSGQYQWEARAADKWGRAYAQRDSNVEFESFHLNPSARKVGWWRAQSTRFLLRWPSAYLCHVTNHVRHRVYGMLAAKMLAESMEQQQLLIRSLARSRRESDAILFINRTAEVEFLSAIDFASDGSLEAHAWHAYGYAACSTDQVAERSDKTAVADATYEGVGGEVYLPRPIVSVHVRQGDKGHDMSIHSFETYMFHVNRFRQFVPHLRYIWLSTEMQAVIDETSQYRDWSFLYTSIHRQQSNELMYATEKDAGIGKSTGNSFANLLIAAECDFFLGPLASNWNRLINELRLTNGRLFSGYTALNDREW